MLVEIKYKCEILVTIMVIFLQLFLINLVIIFRVTMFFYFLIQFMACFFQYNKSGFNPIYSMCLFRAIEGCVSYSKLRLFSLVFMSKVTTFSFFSRK